MQSRLTPSLVATSQNTSYTLSNARTATLSVRFLTFTHLLPYALQFCSEVSKQRGITRRRARKGPQVRNCCCLRPTPKEKMAVAYDVIEDTIRTKLN